MTTQAVSFSVNGPGNQGGRMFSGTATDGAYTAINTTTGSAELGFAMRGVTIDNVAGVYTAGSGAWVIRDRVTQAIVRQGFMFKTGTASGEGYPIQPLTINENHILQTLTLAAGTTYHAWVQFVGKPAEYFLATIADGATGELVTSSASGGQSLGSFANQSVAAVTAQSPDGKVISYAQIFDGNGAEIFAQLGSERSVLGGNPKSGSENLCTGAIAFNVMRGMALKLTVAA